MFNKNLGDFRKDHFLISPKFGTVFFRKCTGEFKTIKERGGRGLWVICKCLYIKTKRHLSFHMWESLKNNFGRFFQMEAVSAFCGSVNGPIQ